MLSAKSIELGTKLKNWGSDSKTRDEKKCPVYPIYIYIFLWWFLTTWVWYVGFEHGGRRGFMVFLILGFGM